MLHPNKFVGYFDRRYWTVLAKCLKALRDEFSEIHWIRIHFATENFKDGTEAIESVIANHGGREALAAAMKPFLDVLGERGKGRRKWWPYICSADERDVCIQRILERVDRCWLLTEDTFNLGDRFTRDHYEHLWRQRVIDIHRKRQLIVAEARKRCPDGFWVPGQTEEIFKNRCARYRAVDCPFSAATLFGFTWMRSWVTALLSEPKMGSRTGPSDPERLQVLPILWPLFLWCCESRRAGFR